jgi:hypothetical protein
LSPTPYPGDECLTHLPGVAVGEQDFVEHLHDLHLSAQSPILQSGSVLDPAYHRAHRGYVEVERQVERLALAPLRFLQVVFAVERLTEDALARGDSENLRWCGSVAGQSGHTWRALTRTLLPH